VFGDHQSLPINCLTHRNNTIEQDLRTGKADIFAIQSFVAHFIIGDADGRSALSTVKLADFGSAFFETDHDNDPTPYLVSRFYRPPEVILGLEYDRMVDLWSLCVTLAELFTGSVLFPGKSNNDMLVRFMDAMGPLSHKMAKRHALSYTRMGLQPHFEVGIQGGTYQFRKQEVDRVTGQPVCRLVNVLSAKADARLPQVLLRASKGGGASERVDVMKFADMLNRCLALDPARRLSVRNAIKHDFFMKKKKREESA